MWGRFYTVSFVTPSFPQESWNSLGFVSMWYFSLMWGLGRESAESTSISATIMWDRWETWNSRILLVEQKDGELSGACIGCSVRGAPTAFARKVRTPAAFLIGDGVADAVGDAVDAGDGGAWARRRCGGFWGWVWCWRRRCSGDGLILS